MKDKKKQSGPENWEKNLRTWWFDIVDLYSAKIQIQAL